MSAPRVSVIVPCFNMGQYLHETLDSVLAQTFKDFEILVIDDGSTERETRGVLEQLKRPKTRLLSAPHQGPASARNFGIRKAQGEYILPLDADDKIGPRYLEEAVATLDADSDVAIVYSKAGFFGEENGPWLMPPYSFPAMLLTNFIFSSAIFRMKDYLKTKGYNSNMTLGAEDHDFWLSIIELGGKVHRLPDVHFFYRQRHDSRNRHMTQKDRAACLIKLYRNHQELYLANMEYLLEDHLRLIELDRELRGIISGRFWLLREAWRRIRVRFG